MAEYYEASSVCRDSITSDKIYYVNSHVRHLNIDNQPRYSYDPLP